MKSMAAELKSINSGDWHRKALVRTAQELSFSAEYEFNWRFPIRMKELLAHPLVTGLSCDRYRFLCVQYFYKYMQDICITETEVVNPAALAIANGASVRSFSPEAQRAAYTIIVDEAYHSFAARSFALSIYNCTGIAKAGILPTNRWAVALAAARNKVPKKFWTLAEFLACCVSESTFTAEILAASKIEDCDPKFRVLMRDHLIDEGRHCSYFKELLTSFWDSVTDKEVEASAKIFPIIYKTLFSEELEKKFDRYLLLCTGLRQLEVKKILNDVSTQSTQLSQQGRVKQSLDFLVSSSVLKNEVVLSSFQNHGLI